MVVDLLAQDRDSLAELRLQPVVKRVRALHGGTTVADSTRAVLVWEPRRVVPAYAVPAADLRVRLVPAERVPVPDDAPPVLDPRNPFVLHTAPGEPASVRLPDGSTADGAAYRLAEADLVVLDFDAFDWLDEDEPLLGHPRDPRHRIDVCRSSRPVRIEHEGRLLAESSRALWLFEGTFGFPRYYLPREDVVVPLVRAEGMATTCAYKGVATYWSASDDPRLSGIAWSYEEPLADAAPVQGAVCFFTERLDLTVDGVAVPRPRTPWSEPD